MNLYYWLFGEKQDINNVCGDFLSLINAHIDSSLQCSTPGNFSLPIALVGNLVKRGLQSQPLLNKKNPQQVLAYTVSECWGHTNDATPEACWQVCYAGAGLDLRAADAHCWQILTPFEARPWVDVLVISMCFLTRAVWGIFTRLKPDPDVHLLT